MKSFTLLTFAAGAAATFKSAPPFTCPKNTDNKCDPKQAQGFDWSDLTQPGSFSSYGNFEFQGWSFLPQTDKRDRYDRRTFGKAIGGRCSQKKSECPSFGSKEKFSLHEIHVNPEFDCDLEFHFDMPDGSLCRQRSPCKKGGSKVKNRQCGGAHSVTVVYPPQPSKTKTTCSVTVTSISFDCTPKPSTSKTSKTTKPPAISTKTSGIVPSTTATSTAETSKPIASTSTQGTASSTVTKPTDVSSVTKTTGTSNVPGSSTTGTSDVPGSSSTTKTSPPPGSSSSSSILTTEVTSTTVVTTTFQSTSTVFTTSTSTIISCSEKVSNCPGKETTAVVTVTVPVSTTICPVTETSTVVIVSSTTKKPDIPPTGTTTSKGPDVPPVGSSTTRQPEGSKTTTGGTAVPVTSTSSSTVPVETLPCPSVVPSCLNTWLFTLNCKDNTDTACYCPDSAFVKNVFSCIYAYGQTDTIIKESIIYLQGICAPHVPQNPAIVTGPTETKYLTVTSTAPIQAIVTTVVISQTTVVPCTDDDGSTIPNSSTTVTINTSVTVPQVGFTTGISSTEVGLVPVATLPQPALIGQVSSTMMPPTGTGSIRPTNSPVTVNAGGRVQVGVAGLVGLVMAVIVVL